MTQVQGHCQLGSDITTRMSNWVLIWIRLAPKWDKSATFSDEISVYFGSQSQNILKSDLKKSRICPI